MQQSIDLYDVSTHNLKNISVSIPKNKITVIYGRSGAGKSSLAFTTLHQLCYDEFEAMENGFNDNQSYRLSNYSGIVPSVAITQHNKNNNPRSTLYSFLNIAQIISSLRLKETIPYSLLKLNKPQNECKKCKGLGEIADISADDLIDDERTIVENPFKIWQKGSLAELHYKLLLAFCEHENIPTDVPYSKLTDKHKNKLLHGESDLKFPVRYKLNGKYRQRRVFYQGVMLKAAKNIDLVAMDDYKQIFTCSCCNGSRVDSSLYKDVKINEISFIDFLTLPISELKAHFANDSNFNYLNRVFESICEMGLGYLNLSRSIPSLSGGELQKIKFNRILNSNISGILIVIDEISSQLSDDYYHVILKKLKSLAKQNTIVLVEHNNFFIEQADYRLHIGKYAGEQGGFVCEYEKIEPLKHKITRKQTKEMFFFKNISKHNIENQSVSLPKKSVVVFTGVSGSGKSSLARWIEQREKAIYITQKNSNYSSRSYLASTLKVSQLIADYFAKETGFSEDDFLINKNAGCKVCQGTGTLKYERGFEKDIYLDCPACDGNLFDQENKLIYQEVNGLSLADFYQKNIKDLIAFLPESNSALIRILETANSLGLGHLRLSRKTQTLSGGETRRLKLCEHLSRLRETSKILIIDEPAAGLDPETASKVANFIREKSHLFATVILIEHRKEVIKYADYEVKIGPYAGKDGGKIMSQNFLE